MVGWLLLLLGILAGVGRILHDLGTHAPEKLAKLGPFWDNNTSWKLKYKNSDPAQGPRFWGADTFFVALTDGWHLSNAVSWAAIDTAVVLGSWPGPYRWWALGCVLARRFVFEPGYRWFRK